MSHSHHDHDHHVEGNLLVAFLINLAFTALEIAGGIFTNSVAILSDALHDAGDCFSLGLAWYLQRVAKTRADAKFTYGYRRLSSLGALITGVVLIIGLVFIAWQAIDRLRNPAPVYAPGVVGLAIAGIFFNGFAAWRMRGGKSLLEKVVSWHLVEDMLGWVAVLVGGICMLVADVPWIDPVLSLGIGLVVLWNVFLNLRKVMLIFLQAAPTGFDREAFFQQLRQLPNFIGVHHTNTWTIDGEAHVFSTHIVLRSDSTREQIVAAKRRVHEILRKEHFEHITVEVELAGENCAAGDCHDEQCTAEHEPCDALPTSRTDEH